jgi:hypothetical protein
MKETIFLISKIIDCLSKEYNSNFIPDERDSIINAQLAGSKAVSRRQSGSLTNAGSKLSLHLRSTENFMKIINLEEKFKEIDEKIDNICFDL